MPRISIGVGMLAPVFPNGLAGVHILVLLTMSLGSTIANTAYSAFVTQVISTGNSPAGALSSFLATLAPANTTPGASTAAATMPSQTADTAKSILDMEICYAAGVQAGNNSWPKVTAQQVIGALQPATGGTPDSANANTLWNYGACGSITFPNTVQSSQVAATGASQSDPAITTFITARNAAMGALISSIRSSGLATQIINTFDPGNNPSAKWPTSIATPLVSPVTTYDQTMTQAAATMLSTIKGSQTSKLLTSSQQIGWIGAGLIYRPLFDASAAASSQAHIMPSIDITKPSPLRITGQIIEQATKRATTDWQSQTTLAGISATNFTGPGNSADNLLMRNIDKLSQSLAQAAIQLGSTLTTGSDPLAGLITLGHLMIGMAEGLIVAGLATAALASNGIAGLAGAAGAWSWAAIWLAAAIAWTLGLGITLAFALPIMPFMAVFWAVIAWFTAGAELMIGLPCWAFAMIRMDGDRFINQQQAAGIAALTSLLLRPTVVVCAFGFAYVMLPLELGLFNALFPVAFVAQQGGHVTGIVAILAALTISTRVQWQIVQMSMRAITTWPDRIAHMWGGRAEGHEEHKNTQGSLGAAFGAGAVVGGSLKSGVERGTGIPAAVEKSKDTASKLKAAAEATAARAAMGPGGANGATA
jgi:conjugal transfer/type IV secretion protein DotA/TraY